MVELSSKAEAEVDGLFERVIEMILAQREEMESQTRETILYGNQTKFRLYKPSIPTKSCC